MASPQTSSASFTLKDTNWALVFLIYFSGVVCAFQVGKGPPLLPVIREDLSMDLVTAGWVISAFNTLGVALGAMVGAMADWAGTRRMFLGGMLFLALGSLAGAWSQSSAMLITTRFFEGIGYILVLVCGPGFTVRVASPKDLRLALGVWGGFVPMGMAFMMVLSPHLAEVSGWRGVWVINGVLLIVMALWLGKATKTADTAPAKGSRPDIPGMVKSMFRVLATPAPVLIALCFCTYSVQYMGLFAFLPTLLIEEQGLSPNLAAAFTALAVFMNVPGNFAGGWVLNRGMKPWSLIGLVSVILGLFSLGIFSQSPPFWLKITFCLLFSGLGGMLPTAAIVAATMMAPTKGLVSTTNGIVAQGAQAGGLLGPPLLAFVVSITGTWSTAPWLMISSAIVGTGLAILVSWLEKNKATQK